MAWNDIPTSNLATPLWNPRRLNPPKMTGVCLEYIGIPICPEADQPSWPDLLAVPLKLIIDKKRITVTCYSVKFLLGATVGWSVEFKPIFYKNIFFLYVACLTSLKKPLEGELWKLVLPNFNCNGVLTPY